MTRLTEAQQRLNNALARLEAALRKREGLTGSHHESLVRELAAMRERYSTMEDRTRDVSNRLDATISRVRSLVRD